MAIVVGIRTGVEKQLRHLEIPLVQGEDQGGDAFMRIADFLEVGATFEGFLSLGQAAFLDGCNQRRDVFAVLHQNLEPSEDRVRSSGTLRDFP